MRSRGAFALHVVGNVVVIHAVGLAEKGQHGLLEFVLIVMLPQAAGVEAGVSRSSSATLSSNRLNTVPPIVTDALIIRVVLRVVRKVFVERIAAFGFDATDDRVEVCVGGANEGAHDVSPGFKRRCDVHCLHLQSLVPPAKSNAFERKNSLKQLIYFATNTDCYGDGYAVVESRPWPAVTGVSGRRRGYAPVFRGCFRCW
jgi:hypothetical protein